MQPPENLSFDGGIIIKWILKMWTGFHLVYDVAIVSGLYDVDNESVP